MRADKHQMQRVQDTQRTVEEKIRNEETITVQTDQKDTTDQCRKLKKETEKRRTRSSESKELEEPDNKQDTGFEQSKIQESSPKIQSYERRHSKRKSDSRKIPCRNSNQS